MKQTKTEIKYCFFGKVITPPETEKKRRAFAYTMVCTALNEIGAGADANVVIIRQIMSDIQYICESETGYEIETYNPKLVGNNYKGWKKNPYSEV